MGNLASPTVVTVSIDDLKPAPYNPRRIAPEAKSALNASLARFGSLGHIVWNKRTGHVIGGHRRLEYYRKNRVKRIDVIEVDMPEDEEKAANIALNSPYLSGEFTDEIGDLLDQIREADSELFDALRLEQLDLRTDDIDEIWKGMPEFNQDDKTAYQQVIINFNDSLAVDEFAKLIGQPMTKDTRSLWFPKAEISSEIHNHYTAEPEE